MAAPLPVASLLPDHPGSESISGSPAARVALLADYLEEGWPSMDLTAEMTFATLARPEVPEVVELVRPPMRRRFTAAGERAGRRFTADRALARHWDYPRLVRSRQLDFDLFHILDHSYAHLALAVPPGRAIVTCHDIDAFRSLVQPEREPRSWAYRRMAARLRDGLQRAARVLCISEETRAEVERHGLVPADRLAVVPVGVHPSFGPTPQLHADAAAVGLLGPVRRDAPELLHVGSTIARKRVDVLLQAFARVAGSVPGARLVRAGGELTPAQATLAARLGIADRVVTLPFLTREVLAAVYRRAALVLQTSDAEGFGLPVAESMACGTPVLASDLAVLREVGGEAATYATAGDANAFGTRAVQLLVERERDPGSWERRRRLSMARAADFTWEAYGERVLDAYRHVWTPARTAAPRPGRG